VGGGGGGGGLQLSAAPAAAASRHATFIRLKMSAGHLFESRCKSCLASVRLASRAKRITDKCSAFNGDDNF